MSKKKQPKAVRPPPKPPEERDESAAPYRVIKTHRRAKRILLSALCALLVGGVIVWHFCLPTGILEFLQNRYALYATDGSGLDGLAGSVCLQADARSGRIDVLTDAYFEVYNQKGGTAFFARHGYSAPAMASADARTVVYDRGGSDCSVYTAQKKVQEFSADGALYTAAIARNGAVAVAYKSDDYLSVIEVYSKRQKLLFSKTFSDAYVTALVLNDSGRYLAAAALYARGGVFHTDVSVFDVRGQTELSKQSYEGVYFNAGGQTGKSAVFAGEDRAVFVSFSDGAQKTPDLPGKITAFAVSPKGTVGFVCAGEDNAADCTVCLYGKTGDAVKDFPFSQAVTGFSLTDSDLYLLTSAAVYRYSADTLRCTQTPVADVRFVAAFRGGAAAVSGNRLRILS